MSILTESQPADIAVRSLPDLPSESVLRSILQSIDDGVLLTDLEHHALACNRRFGEIFDLDPQAAIRSTVIELRDIVAPQIVDEAGWRSSLEQVYAHPESRFEDELTVRRGSDTVLRRATRPVYDAEGRLFGRLWTFTDITEARQRRRNSELLRGISMLSDPDPGANLRAICEAVTGHFGAATQINILEDGFLRFHLNAGDLGPAQHLPGIPQFDTYCGYTMEDDRPLLVQDARLNPRFAGLLPASVGFCRYMGVPVRDEAGKAIGTICIIDQQMDQPLGDADIELMEMVAMRANAELARERYLAERIAEKDRQFAKGRQELEETRVVLGTMNDTFGLLFETQDTQTLLSELAGLLCGVQGYSAAAVFLRPSGAERYEVAVCAPDRDAPCHLAVEVGDFSALLEKPATESRDVAFVEVANTPLGELLGLAWAAVACLPAGEWGEAFVVLGRSEAPPRSSARHALGISAVADGVRLVLAAHTLIDGIARANRERAEAQDKALRSEKLAVVGTLAASTAHDIRNITASLSMLAAESEDPAASLVSVKEQLDRFNVLAHRLLSYARPSAPQSHPVMIPELMDRVLSLTAGQMRVSRVEARLECPPDLPTVLGDGHQLQHLLVNLTLNAVQAMDRSGGHLRLVASSLPGAVEILVVDDGPGIPASVADRLFQPFASSRAQGFGLGLFSARRIAEAHGGTLNALSNPSGGTTMRIELPAEGGAR